LLGVPAAYASVVTVLDVAIVLNVGNRSDAMNSMEFYPRTVNGSRRR
jgi:hypothetical protein